MNRMKKATFVLLTLVFLCSLLYGCSGESSVQSVDASGIKIAFITGFGGLHDHSFNQDTYLGVETFAMESNAACKYFMPESPERKDLIAAIEAAVSEDYDVIVTAGDIFAQPCLEAARKHPRTLFLALAVTPEDMGVSQAPANIAMLTYKEEQAGFLAGYAAVADSYQKLGFLGGDANEAVIRFGYGFIQGADKAAKDLGVSDVQMKYWYSGTFLPCEEIEDRMEDWYQEGTQLIFSCGGAIYKSALQAADAQNGLLIGVDIDQSYLSPRFITSAVKSLKKTVIMALSAAVRNDMTWPGIYAGNCRSLGINEECVGLAMENSHFRSFNQEMYDVLYKAILRGSYTVSGNCDPDIKPDTQYITVQWEN